MNTARDLQRDVERCAEHLEESPRSDLDLLAARLLRQLATIHGAAHALTSAKGYRDRQAAFDELMALMQSSAWRKRQIGEDAR